MFWLPLRLLQHQWRSAVRSVVRPQHIAGTVILSVMVVVLALNLLSLGLFLQNILAHLDPSIDPVAIVNGILLYYFLLDLLLRLWFQRIPGQIVRPYLALPVRRTALVHLLLMKSLLSLLNALPLLLFVPIALRIIAPARGVVATTGWLVSLILLLLTSSIATLYVKKRDLLYEGLQDKFDVTWFIRGGVLASSVWHPPLACSMHWGCSPSGNFPGGSLRLSSDSPSGV